MSDFRVSNLRGRNAGEAPNMPDGVVISGIATVTTLQATNISGNGSGITGISGGGDGAQYPGSATSGAQSTGGGGGGLGNDPAAFRGGNGGSGIVLIAYPS